MTVASPDTLPAGDAGLARRTMRVVRVEGLSRRMRRITLSGEDLAPFDTPRQLHVRLSIGEGASRATRLYTIRRIDAAAGEMDIDFFLHDAPGPAGDWAAQARPGATCEIAGPVGRPVGTADWHVFAGDETALPAISRIVEAMPGTAAGVVVLCVGRPEERVALSHPPGIVVRWVHPRGGETAGDRLFDEVASILPPKDATVFAWAGAHADCSRRLKEHWKASGIDAAQCLAVAYWR
ncbi:NADPH-dependent ferric siderophore reductase [Angulomicrobium tetraedrale]|uniref:NADPH-dependent ferric siderophore reductase n=1 Tax=Ancylobacter tetraedralis TaxID=217068 RepID=A0A839ZCY6_9HYPH|nr:siderophore-interacting protein [Ancylobacter tetraedralis]MBB3772535.1 NADPH-dependent ferric siderophore reductase [Ancylobacter tetraedralis]